MSHFAQDHLRLFLGASLSQLTTNIGFSKVATLNLLSYVFADVSKSQ